MLRREVLYVSAFADRADEAGVWCRERGSHITPHGADTTSRFDPPRPEWLRDHWGLKITCLEVVVTTDPETKAPYLLSTEVS